MASFYGHDPKNALTGPCLVAKAPMTTTAPSSVYDVMSGKEPYTLLTGWTSLGIIGEPPEYEPDWDTEENFIPQDSAAVRRKITEYKRGLTLTLKEHRADLAQFAEEGKAVETIAAGAVGSGKGAGKAVSAGTPDVFTPYRIAVISERDLGIRGVQGVTEAAGAGAVKRGPFVGLFLYRSTLAPGGSLEWDHEDLAGREIEMIADPDPAITDPKANAVRWYFENDGQTLP